jgi:hypothetical protein
MKILNFVPSTFGRTSFSVSHCLRLYRATMKRRKHTIRHGLQRLKLIQIPSVQSQVQYTKKLCTKARIQQKLQAVFNVILKLSQFMIVIPLIYLSRSKTLWWTKATRLIESLQRKRCQYHNINTKLSLFKSFSHEKTSNSSDNLLPWVIKYHSTIHERTLDIDVLTWHLNLESSQDVPFHTKYSRLYYADMPI